MDSHGKRIAVENRVVHIFEKEDGEEFSHVCFPVQEISYIDWEADDCVNIYLKNITNKNGNPVSFLVEMPFAEVVQILYNLYI